MPHGRLLSCGQSGAGRTAGSGRLREIELAVREQLEAGELRGDETLEAIARVTVRGLRDDVVVAGKIALS